MTGRVYMVGVIEDAKGGISPAHGDPMLAVAAWHYWRRWGDDGAVERVPPSRARVKAPEGCRAYGLRVMDTRAVWSFWAGERKS